MPVVRALSLQSEASCLHFLGTSFVIFRFLEIAISRALHTKPWSLVVASPGFGTLTASS